MTHASRLLAPVSSLISRRQAASAISFAIALIYCTPGWPDLFSSVYGFPMIDRRVYELQIIYENLPVDYIHFFDFIQYFTFEWVWNSSLAFLSRTAGLSPDQIFMLISVFVLWRFVFEVATRAGWVYVILLLNPLIVDFAFSQLRLAFAVAVLSFFWTGQRGRVVTITAYVLCFSIHTAIFLFAVMHFAARKFSAPNRISLLVLVFTGALIAVMIGPLREVILGVVGDRRAEYKDMSSSLPYLSFWIAMFFLLLFRWKKTIEKLDGRYAVIVLSLVFVNAFFGGYSTRFIAAAFPSLVIAMSNHRALVNRDRMVIINPVLLLFVPYSILQWLYWFRIAE